MLASTFFKRAATSGARSISEASSASTTGGPSMDRTWPPGPSAGTTPTPSVLTSMSEFSSSESSTYGMPSALTRRRLRPIRRSRAQIDGVASHWSPTAAASPPRRATSCRPATCVSSGPTGVAPRSDLHRCPALALQGRPPLLPPARRRSLAPAVAAPAGHAQVAGVPLLLSPPHPVVL